MHQRGKHEVASEGDGCLIAAIRLPLRIIALVIVLPVRLLWDALAAVGRALERYVLAPFGRGLAWLGRWLVVVPAVALWRYVLSPVGRGIGWVLRMLGLGLVWLGRVLF